MKIPTLTIRQKRPFVHNSVCSQFLEGSGLAPRIFFIFSPPFQVMGGGKGQRGGGLSLKSEEIGEKGGGRGGGRRRKRGRGAFFGGGGVLNIYFEG